MNALKTQHYAAGRLIWLALALWLIWAFGAGAAEEQTFALLKTKTETYTNATVTTKAKTYIFRYNRSSCQSSNILKKRLSAIPKTGSFHRTNRKTPFKLIHNKRR